VLEDLHWADYSTVDLISALARRRAARRVVGYLPPVEIILQQHPIKQLKHELQSHHRCEEPPLELLEAAVAGISARSPVILSPRISGLIYRQTEGNPLFVVTLADDLLRHGLLYEEVKLTPGN
jgi:predicted ATPase